MNKLSMLQRQDEANPREPPTDMEGEILINMVTKAVNAINVRLQSKFI